MPEPVDDPEYWRRRLEDGRHRELHLSIFRCPLVQWRRIEERHRRILAGLIGPRDSVLDCGCGYGRLLTLMPPGWEGGYVGVDLSPDMVLLARETHNRLFMVSDLRDLSAVHVRSDWAVMVSVRPMIVRNMGAEVWAEMEARIRTKADRLLFLEYDELDDGSVE